MFARPSVRSGILRFVLACTTSATGAGCRSGEPPAPAVDAAVSPLPPPTGLGSASPAADASGAPTASEGAVSVERVRRDAGDAQRDGGVLGQTQDKPLGSSDALTTRARALFDGVVHDDPEAAMPFFFPRSAYEQVKDVGNPGADWKRRLVGAYARDVHALHERLGGGADSARFVRLDIPMARAKWVEPGDEYNKVGYHRVYGTKLVYEQGGRERSLDISSLISWRGEWYVVHLTGFK